MITKSGGNDLHGSAFEFLRNTDLDARGDPPPGIKALEIPLLSIASDEQMLGTFKGELAEAGVVLGRIDGRVDAVAGLALFQRRRARLN